MGFRFARHENVEPSASLPPSLGCICKLGLYLGSVAPSLQNQREEFRVFVNQLGLVGLEKTSQASRLFPYFSLDNGSAEWDGIHPLWEMRVSIIWDSIRVTRPRVPWYPLIWEFGSQPRNSFFVLVSCFGEVGNGGQVDQMGNSC
ncbi:hypothetical protein LINPERHAP2_LOCUS27597 [Linum perenne]